MYQNILVKLKITVLSFMIANCLFQSVQAQPLEVVADYPLILNLADSTGNHSDVFLEGNPTPPTTPSAGVELCQNGIYLLDSNGQNIQTPPLDNIDVSNFEIEVEFKVTATPDNFFGYSGIIMGGKFSRFIGIIVDNQNRIGLKYNNESNNINITAATIALNNYYTGKIRYDNGATELFLDGVSILNINLPPLVLFLDVFEFTTTDFNTGQAFEGCIRNLMVSTTTQEIFSNGFE